MTLENKKENKTAHSPRMLSLSFHSTKMTDSISRRRESEIVALCGKSKHVTFRFDIKLHPLAAISQEAVFPIFSLRIHKIS